MAKAKQQNQNISTSLSVWPVGLRGHLHSCPPAQSRSRPGPGMAWPSSGPRAPASGALGLGRHSVGTGELNHRELEEITPAKYNLTSKQTPLWAVKATASHEVNVNTILHALCEWLLNTNFLFLLFYIISFFIIISHSIASLPFYLYIFKLYFFITYTPLIFSKELKLLLGT